MIQHTYSDAHILGINSRQGLSLQRENSKKSLVKLRNPYRTISVSDIKFENSKCLSKLKDLMSESVDVTDIIIETRSNSLSIKHRTSGSLNASIDGTGLSYIEICKFLSEHTGISINRLLISGMQNKHQVSDAAMTYKNQRFRIAFVSTQPNGSCIAIRRITNQKRITLQ